MASRTRPTFAKRQKEQARLEKQRAKAQRKLQRKLENQAAAALGAPDQIATEIERPDSDFSGAATQPAPQMDSNNAGEQPAEH